MFNKPFVSRFSFLSAIVCLTLFTSGCVKEKVLVEVKKDGSGNIVVTRRYSQAVADMINFQIKQMRKQFAGSGQELPAKMKEDPLYNIEQLKRESAKFGQDVSYTKSKKLKTASGSGYVALYAFKDINKIKIPIQTLPNPNGGKSQSNVNFKLTKKGDINDLVVSLPVVKITDDIRQKIKAVPAKVKTPQTEETKRALEQMEKMGNPFKISKDDTEEQIVGKMLQGFEVSIQVEVSGEIVKNNAKFVSPKKKSRFTLLDLDFSEMSKSPGLIHEISKMKNRPKPEEIQALMFACPQGAKYDNQGKISVEYK